MEQREFSLKLSKYDGEGGEVVIPDGTIVIGKEAFCKSKVTSVVIPASVKRIEKRAFWGCKDLVKVSIASADVEIAKDAFEKCSRIRELDLPDGFKHPECFAHLLDFLFMGFNGEWDGEDDDFDPVNLTVNWLGAGAPKYAPIKALVDYLRAKRVLVLRMIAERNDVPAFVALAQGGWLEPIDVEYLDEMIALSTLPELRAEVMTYKNAHYSAEDLRRLEEIKTAKELGTIPYEVSDLEKYFTVKEAEDGYVLSDYMGIEENLILPDTLGGKPVVEIEEYTFVQKKRLKSVVLPSGLKRIGKWAFSHCAQLTSITIGSQLREIEENAFFACGDLKTVRYQGTIEDWCGIESKSAVLANAEEFFIEGKPLTDLVTPTGLKRIGAKAFYGYKKLRSVLLGRALESIGKEAFSSCLRLVSVRYQGDLKDWCNVKDEGSDLLKAAIDFSIQGERVCDLRLPKGLKEVRDNLFKGYAPMKSVAFPKGLKKIGVSAFEGCKNLTVLRLPDSVTDIEDGAFAGCGEFRSVTIGRGIKRINAFAFSSPGGVKRMRFNGELRDWLAIDFVMESDNDTNLLLDFFFFSFVRSFYLKGKKLTSLVLPEGIEEIREGAFADAAFLRAVTLPKSIRRIGFDAFKGCHNLKKIRFEGSIDDWLRVENESCLMERAAQFSLQGKPLNDLVVPDGVKVIKKGTFALCGCLTSVTISDDVTVLEKGAFAHCDRLQKVTLGANLCRIEEKVLSECPSLTEIFFLGPREMWDRVEKPKDWQENGLERKVRCLDDKG